MSEPTRHLLQLWELLPRGLLPRMWCGENLPDSFVTEPLFATCQACLLERTRAASKPSLPPAPEPPAVIVPPYPPTGENPWG